MDTFIYSEIIQICPKPLPFPYQNKATGLPPQKYSITLMGFLRRWFSHHSHVVWQDLCFQLLSAHLRFAANHWREAATCCLLPSASRGALVCTNCLSSASQNQLERSDTHGREGGFGKDLWRGCTFYGWREGVSIWYLVMVDIYGKSYWRVGPPYYIDHRPSLVSWTSPDVHGGICNFDFGFLQMWK